MREIQIELAEPKHGWMQVRVQVGSDEWQGLASYVADCVTDLVYAALELTESREARDVIFFEEPAACRFAVTGTGDIVQVTMTQHPDLAPRPNARNGEVVLSAAVPRMSVAKAIWSALHHLEVTCGLQRVEDGWQKPFPAKEFAQLTARVA